MVTSKNILKHELRASDEINKKKLAATYSPADEPQYHRRERVLLPCSGWERVFPRCYGHQQVRTARGHSGPVREPDGQYGQASRLISNGRLSMLPCLHRHPINQLVWLGSSEGSGPLGCLILGRASRLDAFSGYPFRTSLPSGAPGGTAGSQEVRPLRSSRTKSRTPQASNDCSR